MHSKFRIGSEDLDYVGFTQRVCALSSIRFMELSKPVVSGPGESLRGAGAGAGQGLPATGALSPQEIISSI